MSDCCSEEKLLDLVLNELTGQEAEDVLAHVKDCADCRQLHADLKFSVSFFQNRLGDIPDMPRKLSQRHFKEIITTVRELEAEQANSWAPPPMNAQIPSPTPDYWGRTVAWSVAAAFAIAFGIALFVKRPWEASPQQVVQDVPVENPGKTIPKSPEPKPDPGSTAVAVNPVPPAPKRPDAVPPAQPTPVPKTVATPVNPTPEPLREPEIVAKHTTPEPTPRPNPQTVPPTEPPAPVIAETPSVADITIHSLARNLLPRHLATTPGKPNDSGLKFTPTGYVRKISELEAKQYATATATAGTFVDNRELYELEYKTDDASAKRLIDVNERILMAGGAGSRNMQFKPRSNTLEIIGNRQELMVIHRTQEFLCDSRKYALNLSRQEAEPQPQHISTHRAGVLYMFHGQAIDAKKVTTALPPAVMKRIKTIHIPAAIKLADETKPETVPGTDKEKETDGGKSKDKEKENDSGKSKGKDKHKGRRNKSLFPLSTARALPKKDTDSDKTPDKTTSNWSSRDSNKRGTSPAKVILTEGDFGDISQKTIDRLDGKMITKKSYQNWTFNRIMGALCKQADVPLIDLSDQSESKLSLKLEHISVYQAIMKLSHALDVGVIVTAEGVLMTPTRPDAFQTVIFKVDKPYLRERLGQGANPKHVLKQHDINFPEGAGASVTRNQTELIIHNVETELLKIPEVLNLRKWE